VIRVSAVDIEQSFFRKRANYAQSGAEFQDVM